MTKKHTFRAVIEDPGGGGAFVRIPFNVEEAFGKKRVKIKASIDGELYRGTLVRMGSPYHILIVVKAIREIIGKTFGDEVQVVVEEDLEPRVVEVPPDFKAALAEKTRAQTFFEKLSYTHQREYVNWINEAKRDETRQRRVGKTIEMLKEGEKGR
ncbi:MAG: DUF1905 domain-containing protein [Anaerolineales bacterium]|nr:DUF1905 domain-containing protein [Chloroflexota bacterium]MBL6980488.1 DUF1905 domain-containing protein [Anaerolineales bacterium]